MFLLWLRSNSAHPKPVLIVAPTGLLKNWQAELAQHVEAGLMGPVIEAFGTNLRSYRLEAGSDIRGGTSRLDSGEWEDAGFRDVFATPGLKLCEWPQNAGPALPAADVSLQLQWTGDTARRVDWRALSARGEALLA
jgi:hypothetical protein